MTTYIDDDIDDVDVNNVDVNNVDVNNVDVNKEKNTDFESLLSSIGNLDNSTLNKLAEMKDLNDIGKMDMKEMRKLFSKMNLDNNKLKSLNDKIQQVNTEINNKPLTREELRKKLYDKIKLQRKTRTMK